MLRLSLIHIYARRQADVLQKEEEIDRLTNESERTDKEKSRAALQEILDNGGCLLAPAPGTVVRTLERGDKTKKGEDAVIPVSYTHLGWRDG